jgi:hypothetical protein
MPARAVLISSPLKNQSDQPFKAGLDAQRIHLTKCSDVSSHFVHRSLRHDQIESQLLQLGESQSREITERVVHGLYVAVMTAHNWRCDASTDRYSSVLTHTQQAIGQQHGSTINGIYSEIDIGLYIGRSIWNFCLGR